MPYKVNATSLTDVLVLEPTIFRDERGFFSESFNLKEFEKATGLKRSFVQDNHSRSSKGVLRGLHFQESFPQGKLVRVLRGRVFDVAVDLRENSKNFGSWFGLELSEENGKQLWIPEGFAHGFIVLSESADLFYKTTEYYVKTDEQAVRWNDQDIAIEWPENIEPLLSPRDATAPELSQYRQHFK